MDNKPKLPNHSPSDEAYVGLRCNKCNKPITPETSILTPTGYRCRECVHGQQKVFSTVNTIDLLIGFVVAAALAFAGSLLANRVGFITLLLAPGVGLLISNIVRNLVKRRRGTSLNYAVLAGAIVGCLPLIILQLVPLFVGPGGLLPTLAGLLPVIWQAIYTVVVSTSAFAHLRGLRIG